MEKINHPIIIIINNNNNDNISSSSQNPCTRARFCLPFGKEEEEEEEEEEEDFARHAAHDIDEFYSPVVSRASGDGAEEDLCVIRRWRRW